VCRLIHQEQLSEYAAIHIRRGDKVVGPDVQVRYVADGVFEAIDISLSLAFIFYMLSAGGDDEDRRLYCCTVKSSESRIFFGKCIPRLLGV
jgi:hypothetical protein